MSELYELALAQALLLNNTLRSVTLARTLVDGEKKTPPFNPSKHMRSCIYQDAVLCWTKVFGGDREKTHWKKIEHLLPNHLPMIQKTELIANTGLTDTDWDTYRGRITNIRNKLFAHRDVGISQHHLDDLTPALESVKTYRAWLCNVVLEGTFTVKGSNQAWRELGVATSTFIGDWEDQCRRLADRLYRDDDSMAM